MRNEMIEKVKDALRHPYTWPGGYPIQIYTSDGEIVCHKCIRKNWRSVLQSTKHGYHDGWQVEAVDVLWETEEFPEVCGCGAEIESAYGVYHENAGCDDRLAGASVGSRRWVEGEHEEGKP